MRAAVLTMMAVAMLPACGDKDDAGTATTTSIDGAASSTTSIDGAASSTTSSVVTTTTAAAAATLDCETVGFTPATEDAASSIQATGVSCEQARSFVREAGAVTSSGGPAQVDVLGYRCVRTRSLEDPIPQAFYECTKGDAKVTYVRT